MNDFRRPDAADGPSAARTSLSRRRMLVGASSGCVVLAAARRASASSSDDESLIDEMASDDGLSTSSAFVSSPAFRVTAGGVYDFAPVGGGSVADGPSDAGTGSWDWSAPRRVWGTRRDRDDDAAAASAIGGANSAVVLFNTHTQETLDVAYRLDGREQEAALSEINHFFRDWRTGTVKAISAALLDILHALQAAARTDTPIHLLSGYRTPETNAMLAQRIPGVAKHSLHLEGRAADIFIPGYDLAELHDAALSLGAGGVGYYPRNGFIHVDSGRVRRWTQA